MPNFKSDTLSSSASEYTQIPSGGIIMLGGTYSKYSDSQYENMGLFPCDGRSLDTTTYSELFSAIGYTYGGSGASFLIPNLKTSSKKSILGKATLDTLGANANASHSHAITMTNNTFSVTNANASHNHTALYAGSSDLSSNLHSHASGSAGTNMGGSQKNGPGGTAGGALRGDHTHGLNANIDIGNTGLDSHSHGAANTDTGYSITLHTHNATITTSANSETTSFSGITNPNALATPYANVLYFIKA